MDRIEAMTALLAVVKAGSFSAAARQMGVPPTTLTRQISNLEARLNAKLFNRTTRSLTLTDVGAAYVTAARHIVEDVEEAERAAAGEYVESRGELLITAPAMFGRIHVVPIVAEFLCKFPKIDIRLLLTDAMLHLVDERIDLAVRLGHLANSSLIARQVGEMRTVVCGSPGFLAQYGTPERPEDITTMPTIAVASNGQSNVWRFSSEVSEETVAVPISPRMSVTTTDAAVEAAALGVGLTQQRLYQVADKLASGELVLCLPGFEVRPAPVHVLQVSRDYLPLKARAFLEFAVPALRERLSALSRLELVAPPSRGPYDARIKVRRKPS